MGRLYDHCVRIQRHIEREGLDEFRVRGMIALKAGFLISFVAPEDPDDPHKIRSLEEAARELLGLDLAGS